MKKLFLILLIAVVLLSLPSCRTQQETFEDPVESVKWDMIPCVMVNGALYLTTGYKSNRYGDPAAYDGIIDSEVPSYELPTENNQSNFGSGYYYRYGNTAGTVDIFMNDDWWIYATEAVKESGAYKETAVMDVNEAYQNIFSYYAVEQLHLDYRNFPDDFGGCYIRSNVLYILLVSPTEEDHALWESICGMSDFQIIEVSYSYQELFAAHEALQNYNRSTPDSSPRYETFWNLDMMNNQVTAVILPEMEQDILSLQQEHPCIAYTIAS